MNGLYGEEEEQPTDGFSVNTGDSDTLKGLPLNPAALPAPVTDAAPTPKAAHISQPMALSTRAGNATSLPGMPADVTPDELERYLHGQKESFEKYGADQQFGAETALLKARTSPGNSLANAGAGFADALMQGVSRAGPGSAQKNLQDRQQQTFTDASSTMKGAHDTALADVKESLELDSKNPQSPLSRASQKSYATTLTAAGIPAEAIKDMSADLISDVAGKRITLEDALARMRLENEYRMGELNLQKLTAGANISNQRAQRKEEAAKTLSGRGLFRRGADAVTGNPATKALEDEMTGGTTTQKGATFATEEEAAAAGLPDGTRVTIGGKTGTWRH